MRSRQKRKRNRRIVAALHGERAALDLAPKSMLSRSSRGGVPVFSRPHSKPNDFSDSASSRGRRFAGAPGGRCSGPI